MTANILMLIRLTSEIIILKKKAIVLTFYREMSGWNLKL